MSAEVTPPPVDPLKGLRGVYAAVLALESIVVALALLVLPLFIPVLIFGSSCVVAAVGGFETGAQLSLLTGLLFLALALCPWAAAAALRISAEA